MTSTTFAALPLARSHKRAGSRTKLPVLSLCLVTLLTICQLPATVKTATTTTATTPNVESRSNLTASASVSETSAPTSVAATTTTTKPDGATPQTATTSPPPSSTTTNTSDVTTAEPIPVREPTEQEIQEARKIIHEVASTISVTNPHRLAMNKPAPSSLLADFAPDSAEAHVAEATSQFGLSLMKAMLESPANASERAKAGNTVVSPLSLQILLNMILLGAKDQSATQAELAKVLGYEENELSLASAANGSKSSGADRTPAELRLNKPHEAMHNVVESIVRATHLAVDNGRLLNTNQQQLVEAHLVSTAREMALTEQVNFTLANLMLTNKELIETSQAYESDLKKFYDVKLEHFTRKWNASESSQASAAPLPLHERVNNWVRNVTHNQIVDLADAASLADASLALVLLNAAHFKARWLHTFNSRLTQERPFYNDGKPDGPVDTEFMRQKGEFGYAEFGSAHGSAAAAAGEALAGDDDSAAPTLELSREESRRLELTARLNASALMLPFSLNDGQELSMVVLLPSRRDGLDELLANLNAPALNEIYRSLSEQQVQVDLPKFSIEATHDVKELAAKLGLRRLFEPGAELDRMFAAGAERRAPAKVDKIVHKAKIAVDELGAEAAAASMATVVLRSSIRFTTPTFVADHPFLYVIRHNRSGMPLFMGQVRAF